MHNRTALLNQTSIHGTTREINKRPRGGLLTGLLAREFRFKWLRRLSGDVVGSRGYIASCTATVAGQSSQTAASTVVVASLWGYDQKIRIPHHELALRDEATA